MKRVMLVFAMLLMLSATTVPCFADGNPMPHVCVGKACTTQPTTIAK